MLKSKKSKNHRQSRSRGRLRPSPAPSGAQQHFQKLEGDDWTTAKGLISSLVLAGLECVINEHYGVDATFSAPHVEAVCHLESPDDGKTRTRHLTIGVSVAHKGLDHSTVAAVLSYVLLNLNESVILGLGHITAAGILGTEFPLTHEGAQAWVDFVVDDVTLDTLTSDVFWAGRYVEPACI